MGDSETVTLPESITVTGAPDVRLTANEMRRLKAETGRTMAELMGDDADDADRMQTMVWMELRRMGHRASWEDAGDVAIDFAGEEDPMNGGSPKSLPPSVATGG